jgi:hypothetical protein
MEKNLWIVDEHIAVHVQHEWSICYQSRDSGLFIMKKQTNKQINPDHNGELINNYRLGFKCKMWIASTLNAKTVIFFKEKTYQYVHGTCFIAIWMLWPLLS